VQEAVRRWHVWRGAESCSGHAAALARCFAFVLGTLLLSPPLVLADSVVRSLPDANQDVTYQRLLEASPAAVARSLAPDGAPVDSAASAPARVADLPWYHTGYAWRGPVAERPDWAGLRRDTGYFLGFQVAVVGVLYVMPSSVTKWDKDNGEKPIDRWRENVSNPVWDDDDWWINYILHPYWGATYYTRGRERGLDRMQSFFYSVTLSTLFEYTVEAFFEPVSLNDLVVSPVLGSLLGEYVFAPMRARIRAKPGELDWTDKTLLALTDPLGVVSAWTDRTFGVESDVSVRPIGTAAAGLRHIHGHGGSTAVGGLVSGYKQTWGLHIRVAW
jgi:hypothetical protein